MSRCVVSTWHALPVRGETPTRKILHDHVFALLTNDFVKMGIVEAEFPECQYLTVGLSLVSPTFCIADGL